MTKIKETPINYRVYYKSMKDTYTQKREEATNKLEELKDKLRNIYEIVSNDMKNNESKDKVYLTAYKEYKENKYINGDFLRFAKGLVYNKKGNYEVIGRYVDIYTLAKTQKDIYDTNVIISLCDKLLTIRIGEYAKILKLYYTKVQEKMITEGAGYVFSGMLGWTCINRCKYKGNRRNIDYAATKERKAQLLAEGKKLFNKEEADWCEANGIEYKAEDYRVFQSLDYVYEIPLIGCKLTDGEAIVFQTTDYRGNGVRGRRNVDLLNESGGDIHKICQYDTDIRTKLNICLQADKMLYNKFIRNENQESSNFRAVDRKSR